MIFIATDILNPYKREILSQDSYTTLIDFLVEQFPDGFNRPTDISVNGHEVALADYDIELKEDDVIVLLDRAALPVGLIGGWFITALANLAISVTLSYVANKLFAPDAHEAPQQTSSVYNLNSAQNIARYGSPVPIIYGKVRMFPSMIVQPYYRFDGNVEYLYHVLCVGQGTCTADEVLIGDDVITNAGDFDWKLLYQNSFYNIPHNAYGVHLTKTLSVPSTMELKGGGAESEKYTISADASKVEFDYMYPRGLFYVKGDGEYTSTSSSFKFRIYTLSGSVYTQVFSETILDSGLTVDAIQKTYTKDISIYNEPVYVSFQRIYYYDHPRDTHDLYIKRVKEIHPNEDFTQRYGDITLLACKIKATGTVSSAGQVKVNGYFTRADVGNTMSEVLTDLYTNTNYGGGLSSDDLNFPATEETVNCAYDSNMTLFDAMRRPAISQGYSLYLAGMDVILKKDAPNTITSAMYNEMNILRNSFKAQYLFKEEYPSYDGFKCTYIDGNGWVQRSSLYPPLSTRPKTVDLFGVVDYGQLGIGLDMTVISTTEPTFIDAGGSPLTDITVESVGTNTWHVYADSSITYVRFTGNQTGITSITVNKSTSITNTSYMFYFLPNVTSIDVSGMDTSLVTDMSYMFGGNDNLLSVDCSMFNTVNVTNMEGMFDSCVSLSSINLTGFNTANVTNMSVMFNSTAISSIDVSMFNTANVTNMSSMFSGTSLTNINLSSFTFINVNMTNMFSYSSSLVCLSNLDTTSATFTSAMFTGCTSLTAPDAATQTLLLGGYSWTNPSACP